MSSTTRELFTGVRVTIRSPQPWKETNAKLREAIKADSFTPGNPFGQAFPPFARARDTAGFERLVASRCGPFGFMLFNHFRHSIWLPMYLPKEDVPQTMTYVIGNPLIALTMLKHDINSALHVPFRFSVNEEPNGGSSVCYIIPSSQIAIGALTNPADEKALRDAAMVLDEKVEALARHVTGTVSGSLEKESSSQSVDARL